MWGNVNETQFHEANDSLDVTKLPSIYAKDARIQFGNSPAILGLDAAKTHFESHWSGLEMMHHEIHEFGKRCRHHIADCTLQG